MSAAKILLVLSAVWLADPCFACFNVGPSETDSANQEYETVFLGQLTGVHLLGFEHRLTGQPDIQLDLGDGHMEGVIITDGGAPVDLDVVPLQIARGAPEKVLRLGMVGCTYNVPALKSTGIFFVGKGGKSAITLWSADTEYFRSWLARLGLKDSHLDNVAHSLKP